MSKMFREGSKETYGSAFKKVLEINGEIVEITYQKLVDGTIKISNGWIK